MTPADVLDAAADQIERHGWAQLVFDAKDGSRCVLGAINRVVGSTYIQRDRSKELLWAYIGQSPMYWNDKPGRTADEVIETLRKAAAAARWTE